MFQTIDGGIAWTPMSIPATVPCEGSCGTITGVAYPLEWVSCPSTTVCYAGGTQFIGSHEGFAVAILTMTASGGPWVLVRAGMLGFAPNDAVCPRPGHCTGVFSTSPFDPGTGIWRTFNGGLTWRSYPGGSPRIRNAVACVASQTCVSVGNQGSITATTTGVAWYRVKSPTSRNLFGVTCVNAHTCYAVGNNGTIIAQR